MAILNFSDLAQNDLREKALSIADAGYDAINIESSVFNRITQEDGILFVKHFGFGERTKEFEIDLQRFERVFLIGIGKGSALASLALAKVLGNKPTQGIALDIQKPKTGIANLRFLVGTHPMPSKINIAATQEIVKLASDLKEKDLLIAFICGGGSALACVSETEFQESTLAIQALTRAGANIVELNTVRKHLSEFKGGGLSKMACPATILSLIVSDICGNDLSMVSSGPTVFDKTTKADAEKILKKYGLNAGEFHLLETPKDLECFSGTTNLLFVCNEDAVSSMLTKAEELGFKSRIRSFTLEGEAKEIFLPILKEIKSGEAIISAGETTVTMKKSGKIGKGGRNQEAVLGVINSKELVHGELAISFASDGRDNTEAAGAIADILTVEKARKLKLNPEEFLKNHDSFNFFEKTRDLIYTERNNFNVADFMLVLKK